MRVILLVIWLRKWIFYALPVSGGRRYIRSMEDFILAKNARSKKTGI